MTLHVLQETNLLSPLDAGMMHSLTSQACHGASVCYDHSASYITASRSDMVPLHVQSVTASVQM